MKKINRIISLLIIAVMIVSLSACGSSFEDKVTALVQGNLDSYYLGVNTEDYLKLINSTEAECRADYDDRLDMEAEYFAYYFDIEYLDDDLKSEIIDLYKIIFANSKYVVSPASKLDDKTYAVKLEIYPIDIIDLVTEDEVWDAGIAAWNEKYIESDIDEMTEEEYMQFDHDWAETIIDIFYEQMPNLGYMDSKTIVLQIVKDTDGAWMISDDDMTSIDNLILYYPD